MKIIIVSVGSVFVLIASLLTVKIWGQSQVYSEYKHPFFQTEQAPIVFIRPSYDNLEKSIKKNQNLFLELSITFDQKFVLLKKKWPSNTRPVRLLKFDEIKDDALLLTDFKDQLKTKKIIFSLIENAAAVHESFIAEMKKLNLEKGENFLVTSPYEAPVKALKEIAPALLFGSTQPEILKIVAMQSMYILEAVNLRADVIIHPIKIRNQNFYNPDLLVELKKRHKKIIVGPLSQGEEQAALELNPFGIIINE